MQTKDSRDMTFSEDLLLYSDRAQTHRFLHFDRTMKLETYRLKYFLVLPADKIFRSELICEKCSVGKIYKKRRTRHNSLRFDEELSGER